MIKKVVLSLKAQQNITEEIGKKPRVETGGVLCGFYKDDEIIITEASGPGLDAVHEIDEFIMDKTFMYAFLDQVYADSLGQSIYIGEWHTHPQVYPEPSPQDFVSIAERSLEWQHGEIVFLIIGFIQFTDEVFPEQLLAIQYNSEGNNFYQVPAYLS